MGLLTFTSILNQSGKFYYNPRRHSHCPGGVLLGIFGGGVPPASPNPDPISDQKMPFPIPISRPDLKNPYPFSDLTLYVIKHSICISAEWNST